MKLAIEGTCLCERVKVGAARMPRQVTQCNCTVCRKYGTLWAYYPRSAISIVGPRGALEAFKRRPRGLRFVRCASCGCVIQWDSPRKGPEHRIGINARLFDQTKMANVPIKVLDGDHTWRTLEIYRKPAIWTSPLRSRGR